MRTKVMAITAVLAMLGVAVFGFIPGTDADADKDLTITFDGMIPTDVISSLISEDGALAIVYDDNGDAKFTAYYVTVLLDDAVDKVTILNKDLYDEYIKHNLKGSIVTYPVEDVIAMTDDEYEGFASALGTFTVAEVNKLGEIVGGVTTKLVLTGLNERESVEVAIADPTLIYTQADMDQAVADAVSVAVAGLYTEEQYDAALATVPAGYISVEAADAQAAAAVEEALADVSEYQYTQADLDAAVEVAVAVAVAQAVADTKAGYEGYLSPEDAKAAIDKAVADATAGLYTQEDMDKAIADTKKADADSNVWLYAFVLVLIAFAGLAGFVLFKMYGGKKTKGEVAE